MIVIRAILLVASVIFCRVSPLVAQTNPSDHYRYPSWTLDGSVSGSFGVGIEDATSALGVMGSATIVRAPQDRRRSCFGVTAIGSALWSPAPLQGASAFEYWALVGPRWDGHDGDQMAFIHLISGIRRINMINSLVNPVGETSFAFGAGFGLDQSFVRRIFHVLEVNYVFTPTSSYPMHRITISSGVGFRRKM